jgi:hypothetical protein
VDRGVLKLKWLKCSLNSLFSQGLGRRKLGAGGDKVEDGGEFQIIIISSFLFCL